MTSDEFTQLRTTSSPYLLLVDSTPAAMERYAWALAASRITVRMLRGERMRQQYRLFSEFAAALQFPYYFGENWNAFDECITDLEWLPGEAYVLIVTNADQVLSEDGPAALETLMKLLDKAGREWAASSAPTESGRTQVPFHVVFQETQGSLRQQVDGMGVTLGEL